MPLSHSPRHTIRGALSMRHGGEEEGGKGEGGIAHTHRTAAFFSSACFFLSIRDKWGGRNIAYIVVVVVVVIVYIAHAHRVF